MSRLEVQKEVSRAEKQLTVGAVVAVMAAAVGTFQDTAAWTSWSSSVPQGRTGLGVDPSSEDRWAPCQGAVLQDPYLHGGEPCLEGEASACEGCWGHHIAHHTFQGASDLGQAFLGPSSYLDGACHEVPKALPLGEGSGSYWAFLQGSCLGSCVSPLAPCWGLRQEVTCSAPVATAEETLGYQDHLAWMENEEPCPLEQDWGFGKKKQVLLGVPQTPFQAGKELHWDWASPSAPVPTNCSENSAAVVDLVAVHQGDQAGPSLAGPATRKRALMWLGS